MTDDEYERPRRIKLLVSCVVIAIVAVGVWQARPLYRSWKKQRYLAHATGFLQQSDFKNAALSARQVLALDPLNLEALRVMAEITGRLRSPELIVVRQRMVDVAPEDPANRIALAEAASQFGDFTRAERELSKVAPTHRDTVEFHKVAALALAGLNKLDEAEAHFTVALKLDPTNALLRLNHAVILLQARDTNVVTTGMETLEKYVADPVYHRMALQNLTQAHLHGKNYQQAISTAKQLTASTNASFGDQMLLLSVLRESRTPEYASHLSALETNAAATGPEQVQALASWLLSTGQADEAARWLASLPGELRSQQRVSMVLADLHLARADWPALQKLTESTSWGDADFLRHAMLARAWREQRQEISSTSAWLDAVRGCNGRPNTLSTLARIAGSWGWSHEEEELLWTLVERHPGERWASGTLNEFYLRSGDTRGLNRLYAELVSQNPNNLAARNNFAATSLLLGLQSARANELAREAFLKFPSNATCASTYAYSLFLQGKREEAVKAFAQVEPAALEQPSVAIYYGIILGSNSPVEAARYLDLAAKGQLLPEERALLEAGRSNR